MAADPLPHRERPVTVRSRPLNKNPEGLIRVAPCPTENTYIRRLCSTGTGQKAALAVPQIVPQCGTWRCRWRSHLLHHKRTQKFLTFLRQHCQCVNPLAGLSRRAWESDSIIVRGCWWRARVTDVLSLGSWRHICCQSQTGCRRCAGTVPGRIQCWACTFSQYTGATPAHNLL